MKNIIYEIMINVQERFTGPFLRTVGRKMYAAGNRIEG